MTRFWFSLSICLSAVLLGVSIGSVPSRAQETDRIATADYDVQALTYPALPEFKAPTPRRVELDNGMVVFLLEDHELPEVNAVAQIGAGSVYEPADKRGLASLTGQVMRTGGTATHPPDTLNRMLEDIGATVETSMGETSGSAFMRTLSDHVDTVLPVFAEVLRRPAFAEEKLQQAKKQTKSAISRRNDHPRQIATRELDKLIYGDDSPYARTPEYFTVDRIERADLVDFHDQYVRPNNVIVSVWGDFEADAMADKIRTQFGDWSGSDEAPPSPPQPTAERASSVNLVPKDDVNQSTVLMGHIGRLTRDDPAYPAATIMNEVLSGGLSGRLFQNVRREKGLAYSVFGNYSAGYERPGRFFAGIFTKSSTTVKGTEAVMHEVERMRKAPPTDDELRLAKDGYLNSFVFNFDTKRKILSRLMTYEAHDYPSDFLQQMKKSIETVTADEVQQVAKEHLYPDESHILVVGKPDDFRDSLSTLADDGVVNEIDVSIPTRPPEPQDPRMTEGEDGLPALRAVKQVLGGEAFDAVENVSVVSRQTMRTQGEKLTIDLEATYVLPDKYFVKRSTPQGTVQITVNGNRGRMTTPQGTRAVPTSMRNRLEEQLWRDFVYLMNHLDHEELTVRDLGTATVEGTPYRAVKVFPPSGSAFTLHLDPESMRPARMSYEARTREGTVTSTSVYSKYKTVQGMDIPFKTVTYQDDEKKATVQIQEMSVNEDVPSDLFTIEEGAE